MENPPAGGPQLRVENAIKALHAISELTIVCRATKPALGGEAAVEFYKRYSREFYFSPYTFGLRHLWYRFRQKGINAIKKLCRVNPGIRLGFECLLDPIWGDAKFIVRLARQKEISLIWFGYGNISYTLMKYIKKLAPELRLVCDTDSVQSRFVLRRLPYETDPKQYQEIEQLGAQQEAYERDWVQFCDMTTAVSVVDRDYYLELTTQKNKVAVFSNVIDLESYKNPVPPPQDFKAPSIYLAGSYGPNSPMDQAGLWMLDEVFPKVLEKVPNAHLYLVGTRADDQFGARASSNIHIYGKQESLLPFLQHTTVSVVPLKYESGTRFKILEAAACGVPIVSTTLGAEGLPVTHGKDILIADDPTEFANAIIEVLNHPEFGANLAQSCQALVREHSSVQALEKEATAIVSHFF